MKAITHDDGSWSFDRLLRGSGAKLSNTCLAPPAPTSNVISYREPRRAHALRRGWRGRDRLGGRSQMLGFLRVSVSEPGSPVLVRTSFTCPGAVS